MKLTKQGVRDLNTPGNKRVRIVAEFDCRIGRHRWGLWIGNHMMELIRRCGRCGASETEPLLPWYYHQ